MLINKSNLTAVNLNSRLSVISGDTNSQQPRQLCRYVVAVTVVVALDIVDIIRCDSSML